MGNYASTQSEHSVLQDRNLKELLNTYPAMMDMRKDTLIYLREKNINDTEWCERQNKLIEQDIKDGKIKGGLMKLVRYGKRDCYCTHHIMNFLSDPTTKELAKLSEFNIKIISIKNSLSNDEYCSLKNAIVDVIPSDDFYDASLFNGRPNKNIDDILYKERLVFNREFDEKQISYSLDKIAKKF